MYNTIIIGGGASGLICAITLARRGKSVLIIEKQDKLGKKILATGNGRCNLTNIAGFNEAYNHNLNEYLSKFDNDNTLEFFHKLGLITYSDSEGRVYPISNCASSVVDVLNFEIKRLCVDSKLDEEVVDVVDLNGKFNVKTDKSCYLAKNLVFCCGGKINEPLFKKLGVSYNKIHPVLCSLKTEWLGSLDGVRQSNVVVKCCGFKECGEVLFKESKISGIVIFNLSAYVIKHNLNIDEIFIDLLPNYSIDELCSILNSRKLIKDMTLSQLLIGIFHKELAKAIIKHINLDFDFQCSNLTTKQIVKICNNIKNFSIKIKGFCDNNQVFAGGVPLNLMDANLMYKAINNLYVAGEALDVFGKCGGYNLQWAFTSGYIIGNSIP